MSEQNGSPTDTDGSSRTVVAGHFEVDLTTPLGSGGMALVYRGRDLRTRRTVALKTLRAEFRDAPETRARFRREARTLAFMQHPNVARVYDLFDGGDEPWVVMEFVPGRSLKEELAAEGPLDLDLISHILDQIAGALTHLHRRGLVHLDIKPQNAILTPERTVKLIDFGLTQEAGHPQEMIGGVTFGTAAYLAPEQATGEAVSPATDIYALGCVVYELLTGTPVFDSNEKSEAKNDLIRKHVEQQPVPPAKRNPERNLPKWIDDVVLASLAKDPNARYGTVEAFAAVFRDGLEGTVIAGKDVSARVAESQAAARQQPAIAIPRPSPRRGVTAAIVESRSLRSWLWKLVAVVAVLNILLGVSLYAADGKVPLLIAGDPSFYDGGRASVAIQGSRLRAGPSLQDGIITELDAGTEVRITGKGVRADDRVWWPARVVNDSGDEGYIAQDGLRPTSKKGPAILTDLFDRIS